VLRYRGELAETVPVAPLTTFGIGGPARWLASTSDVEDIQAIIRVCRKLGIALYVLGAGSNVLVPDEGIDGVVLVLTRGLSGLSMESDMMRCQAGVRDEALSLCAWSHGIAGYEWLFDIPGSVGGAVYMNAGCNEGDMAGLVLQVTWLDIRGEVRVSDPADLNFGYRHSRFHDSPGLVVEALLRADTRDDPAAIRARMETSRATRKSKFPPESLCAGSVFKRPPGHFAGKLIEDAGCGGMTVGDAMVSPKHKGFIVNRGAATARDVKALMEQVSGRVLRQFGIRLEPEVVSFEETPFIPAAAMQK
jgi:UDP-N-acetylmuramate dehydrogenase